MHKLTTILLVALFQTSLPEILNNDAIIQQPIRRTQYGFLRGLRLKTEPWNVAGQMEGNHRDDYLDPEFQGDHLSGWKDILEAGLGPMDGQLEVEAYLGIQYASLLNSNLRFMPPTGPTESWHGQPRNATDFRPVCPQPSAHQLIKRSRTLEEVEKWKGLGKYLERQEEECLFLNVYVPVAKQQPTNQKQSNSSILFPVLMIVHAESFESGTGNALDGSNLSAVGHLVVVTINFRLGILGFFSTGDYLASGNYAILDLVAALQFIKANIESFNGDANKVTILGHGAGSPLVSLLLRSPVVKGKNLFKRVILLGNVALTPSVVVRQPWSLAIKLAALVNCSHKDRAKLVACLKKYPHDLVANLDLTSLSLSPLTPTFGPVLDGSVVPPTTLMNPLWVETLKSSNDITEESFNENSTQTGDIKFPMHKINTFQTMSDEQKFMKHHQKQQKRAFLGNMAGLLSSGIDDSIDLMIGLSSVEQVLTTLVNVVWDFMKSFSNGRLLNKLNLNFDKKHQTQQFQRRKKVEHNWTRKGDLTRSRGKEPPNKIKISNSSDIISILSQFLASETNRQALIANYVRSTFSFHRRKIFDALAFHYRDWEKPGDTEATLRQIYEFFSDGMFLSASTDLLNHHSSSRKYDIQPPSNCYLFDFSKLSSGYQFWGGLGEQLNWLIVNQLLHLLGSPKLRDGRVFWSFSSENIFSYKFSTSLSSFSTPPFFSSPSPSRSSLSSPSTSSLLSSQTPNHHSSPRDDPPSFIDFTMATLKLEEMKTSAILKLFTINFIKRGNPNNTPPSSNHLLPFWPSYNNNDKNYFKLDDDPRILHHFRGSKMALWHDLIPRIHRSDNIEQELAFIERGVSSHDNDVNVSVEEGTHSKNIDFPKSGETLGDNNVDDDDDDLKNYSLSPGIWWFELDPSSSDESQPHDQSINSSTNSTNALPWASQHLIQHSNNNRSHFQKQTQKIQQWTTSRRKGNLQGPTSFHSEDGGVGDPPSKENLSLAATLGVGSLLLFVNLSVFGAILLRRLKIARCNRSPGEELFSSVKKRVRIDDQINKEIIDLYCDQNAHEYDESIDAMIISSDERTDDANHQPLISNHQINHHLQNKCLKLLPMKRDSKSANELSLKHQHPLVRSYKASLFRGNQHADNLSSYFNSSGEATRDILMTSFDSTNLLENETRSSGKAGHFETDSDDFLVSFSSVERQSSSPILHSSHNKFSEAKKQYRQANQSKTSPKATSTIISCHAHITGDPGQADAPKELPFSRQSSSSDRTISSKQAGSFNKSTHDQTKFSIRQNEFHSSPITSV